MRIFRVPRSVTARGARDLVLEFVIVFLGVYLAFVFSDYQERLRGREIANRTLHTVLVDDAIPDLRRTRTELEHRSAFSRGCPGHVPRSSGSPARDRACGGALAAGMLCGIVHGG